MIISPEVDSLERPKLETVAVTTARELLQTDRPADKFGLLDCAVEVGFLEQEGVRQFGLEFQRPPFEAEEFIDFFNEASPSQEVQSSIAIAGDWVIATNGIAGDQQKRLADLHRRIPSWLEFLPRATHYYSLAKNVPWMNYIYPLTPEDEESFWKDAPKPLSKSNFVMAVSQGIVGTQEKTSELRYANSVIGQVMTNRAANEPEALAKELGKQPTALMIKGLQKLGFCDVVLCLEAVVRELNPSLLGRQSVNKEVVSKLSKMPFEERTRIQSLFVEILLGLKLEDESSAKIIDRIADNLAREYKALVQIDDNGEKQFVIFDSNVEKVPLDYRQKADPYKLVKIDDDFSQWIKKVHTVDMGDFNLSLMTYITRDYQKSFYGTVVKTRRYRAVPSIVWIAEHSGKEREVSLEISATGVNLGAPITTVSDGLFGLIGVHFLDQQIELPEELGLPGSEVKQRMGAAQLPLLALMYKKKIVGNSRLLTSAEALVTRS